ncbi:hypothetical protein DFH27DRAFT_616430 [Peziza echinospora]|nr:hypothetical protein DFH27DRAFT_616430 [Peziza echinospora]
MAFYPRTTPSNVTKKYMMQLQDTYISNQPSSRTSRSRKQEHRPAVRTPVYSIYNNNSSSREWVTEAEPDEPQPTSKYNTSRATAGRAGASYFSSRRTPPPQPAPRRSFAEYIFQYAQRLRKKGKRVRFVPQPTEIPAPSPPRRSHHQSSSTSMGSSSSKPIVGGESSSRHHHRRNRTTSSSSRAPEPSGQGTYTYTYTYPQFTPPQPQPPIYTAPESAYYLGTEQIPALYSLNVKSPKNGSSTASSGSVPRKSSSRRSGGRSAAAPPQYGSYYTDPVPPPSYHYGGGYSAAGPSSGGSGGTYMLGQDGNYHYYQYPTNVGYGAPATWGDAGGGLKTSSSKRHRGDQSGSGREKKLRRAKAVEDIRGRSLRGGRDYGGGAGWISVGA